MFERYVFSALFVAAFATGISAQFTYDAAIEGDIGLRQVCDGEVVPVLKIRNNGTETMFGCVVETWKNGFQVGSFAWQLAVPAATGQLRQPAFPAVTSAVPGDGIEMRIISVNGSSDQYADGNTWTIMVGEDAPVADTYLAEVRLSTTARRRWTGA